MADMTEEEIEHKKGLLTEVKRDVLNGGRRFEIPQGTNIKTLPDAVDWAKSGEIYAVKLRAVYKVTNGGSCLEDGQINGVSIEHGARGHPSQESLAP